MCILGIIKFWFNRPFMRLKPNQTHTHTHLLTDWNFVLIPKFNHPISILCIYVYISLYLYVLYMYYIILSCLYVIIKVLVPHTLMLIAPVLLLSLLLCPNARTHFSLGKAVVSVSTIIIIIYMYIHHFIYPSHIRRVHIFIPCVSMASQSILF